MPAIKVSGSLVYMRYIRSTRRYAVPVAIVAAIAGAALVPTLSGASSPPALPAQTAQQVLADIAQAKVPALSGTLTWTANLGLSDLSTIESELGQGGGSSGSDAGSGFNPLSLLAGSYQIDVWLGGAQAEHLALSETPDQEVDLVRNGNQVWLWDSSNDTVTHLVGHAASQSNTPATTTTLPASTPLTPQQMADRLLNHLDPTTSVTVGAPLYVAGQEAYQLLVAPKAASGSTIDHIEIDVGANAPLAGVPLQVAIYANGQAGAAIELGYTGQLNIGEPPASELTFTPPAGAKVVTHEVGGGAAKTGAGGGQPANPSPHSGPGLKNLGHGWTSVVTGTDKGLISSATSTELDAVTVVVQVGDQSARLFSTNLLNVLLMPDGQIYAGFVTPSVLEAAASSSS